MNQPSDILDHVGPALLVIFRISGLMIYGPIFGSSVIPIRIKLFLSLVLGLAVYPLVGSDLLASVSSLGLWTLAPVMVGELMIGLVIGFVASMPFVAVQAGGLIMGQQMGLGFARFFNPAMEDNADVLGQVLFFMILATFVMIGGHEWMVLAVLHSFDHIPLPVAALQVADSGLVALLVGMLKAVLEVALRVAAPLLALIFMQTVAMGFIAKTVPQMNILSLGFPLRILGGLVMLVLGIVVIDEVMMEFIDEIMTVIFDWIEHG